MASPRTSLWRRLLGRKPTPPPLPQPAAEPQHLGSADEAFLAKLVSELANGKRRNDIGAPEVVHHIDGLWSSGHERLAIEWMEKLLSVPEVPEAATAPLRAVLVERYEQRGELDVALPHLERLTGDDRHALRAHYLLAEHARKHGDHERALRHYEAVLGRDVDYPNVRARVERLRALTGRAARSPARRSRPATSPGSRPARAIAWCASSAAARPASSTSRATSSSSATSRSSSCTRTSPAPSAPTPSRGSSTRRA